MNTTSSASEFPAFRLTVKSKVSILGGDVAGLRQARSGADTYGTVTSQLVRRIEQAGGSLDFQIDQLPANLREAAFFYFGAATYAFESNPGYRYSGIRYPARQTLLRFDIRPLSTDLRSLGLRAETDLRVDDIHLGSIKFLQTVGIIVTIAANAPKAYDNFQHIYLPQAKIIKAEVEKYLEEYFDALRKAGLKIQHDTPPINIPERPELVHPHEQRNRRRN